MRVLAVVVGAVLGVACGGAQPQPTPLPTPKPAASSATDDRSGFAQADFGAYRSERFGISVPLPDRATWTIVDRDDQNGGWVVATHAATGTVVRVRRFEETMLVGRHECEMRAQLIGELPRPEAMEEGGHFTTLVDEPLHRPVGWDGRRWVSFEPKSGGRLGGHAMLVSGRQHSCLIVHVLTEVKGDTEADALADRLELFSSRTISGVTADRAKEPDPLLPLPPKPKP
jgi:hypothetical protein